MPKISVPFIASAMVLAVASAAVGQEATPSGRPGAGAATTPVPDFSGVWAHPYFPGFEPPATGPGPITNRSRLRGGPRDGLGNANQFVGNHESPILKPQAAEVLKEHGKISLSGAT